MRLEHTNITVNNIDQSYEFYRAALGFEKRWQGEASGDLGPIRAAHVGNRDYYLAFFEAEQPGRAPRGYGAVGVNHIAFVVEDLAPYRARLADMGVDIHLDHSYDPGEHIYFFDPDGIEIELVAYPDG